MKKIYAFLFVAILFCCVLSTQAQTTINVVFHVVYNTSPQNIPDSCLQHQLDVLNEDYNAANADLVKVPAAWVPIIGNMNVNFVLATTDPSGNPTNGIERRQYPTVSWTTNDNVKHFANGGLDAWPDTSYLNIWVCNLANGLLGYTQMPGGPDATDGVVLYYRVVGRGTYAMSPFNLGRAGTHEVAHWFGLTHFGPDPNCSLDTDDIPDTPTFSSATIYGGFNPFQVVTDACNSSAPGVMWMNFMTYVDDSSMYFFTQNQVDTMTWVMLNMRLGHGPTSAHQIFTSKNELTIFPSPSTDGHFTFHRSSGNSATLFVYNSFGEIVDETISLEKDEKSKTLDLSHLPSGIYFIVMRSETNQVSQRISIVK